MLLLSALLLAGCETELSPAEQARVLAAERKGAVRYFAPKDKSVYDRPPYGFPWP